MPLGAGVEISASERSAARLAHQSGGLGVESSNLSAPTKKPPPNQPFLALGHSAAPSAKGTEGLQSAPSGTQSPAIVPQSVRGAFSAPSTPIALALSEHLASGGSAADGVRLVELMELRRK